MKLNNGKVPFNGAKTETEAKKPYEPPKATFIPLKIEERLMKCHKTTVEGCKLSQLSSS
jgi:hypothetical protein